jgi:hypothetical protein
VYMKNIFVAGAVDFRRLGKEAAVHRSIRRHAANDAQSEGCEERVK